jgi:cytochrome c556
MKQIATTALLASALLAVGANAAWAQAKPEDVLTLRKSVMQVIRANFGPIAATMKGEANLDMAAIQLRASRFAAISSMSLEVWAPGTGMDKLKDSKAKPEIWTKMDDFKAKGEKMIAESKKLAEAAKGGSMDAVKAQVGEVGKACKACHDDFRAE